MSKCTITWAGSDTVKISGTIDENVSFIELTSQFKDKVSVDFGGVTRINSCGVREWTKAIRDCKSIIHYVNAPSIIVDQFSMVPEFLGQGVVDSFTAHYACDSCGNEEDKLLQVGTDIKIGVSTYQDGPAHTCSKCKAQMEFDHSPEVYLHFLTKMGKRTAA